MALSNIRREPQREITESVIGILATIVFLTMDFHYSRSLAQGFPHPDDRIFFTGVLMIVGCFLIPLSMGFIHLTHYFGEEICGWLSAVRLDPRPRNRR